MATPVHRHEQRVFHAGRGVDAPFAAFAPAIAASDYVEQIELFRRPEQAAGELRRLDDAGDEHRLVRAFTLFHSQRLGGTQNNFIPVPAGERLYFH